MRTSMFGFLGSKLVLVIGVKINTVYMNRRRAYVAGK